MCTQQYIFIFLITLSTATLAMDSANEIQDTLACPLSTMPESKTCPICQEDINSDSSEKSEVILHCNHIYHNQCLKPWLVKLKASKEPVLCPYCKQEFSTEDYQKFNFTIDEVEYLLHQHITELTEQNQSLRNCTTALSIQLVIVSKELSRALVTMDTQNNILQQQSQTLTKQQKKLDLGDRSFQRKAHMIPIVLSAAALCLHLYNFYKPNLSSQFPDIFGWFSGNNDQAEL